MVLNHLSPDALKYYDYDIDDEDDYYLVLNSLLQANKACHPLVGLSQAGKIIYIFIIISLL